MDNYIDILHRIIKVTLVHLFGRFIPCDTSVEGVVVCEEVGGEDWEGGGGGEVVVVVLVVVGTTMVERASIASKACTVLHSSS